LVPANTRRRTDSVKGGHPAARSQPSQPRRPAVRRINSRWNVRAVSSKYGAEPTQTRCPTLKFLRKPVISRASVRRSTIASRFIQINRDLLLPGRRSFQGRFLAGHFPSVLLIFRFQYPSPVSVPCGSALNLVRRVGGCAVSGGFSFSTPLVFFLIPRLG
jgi:hypothetical protein